MARSFAFVLIVPLLFAASWCPPKPVPHTTCTYTVQLAQHSGVFLGAGVPATGGGYSVDVIANPSSCLVPTSTPDSWITIEQEIPDRGLGFKITAAANPGAARRTGTAYVGNQALTVDQAGTGGSGCTFVVNPASASFTDAGGAGTFVIEASDARCGWSVDRSAYGEDWSTEPKPDRGAGTTQISFSVRSAASVPQVPLPRQAEMRVTDSANAAAGSHVYVQR